jgi:hypothetical protein
VPALLEGGFVDRRENVLAFGKPGSGKPRPGAENHAQRNTPLVTEECEGEITVVDPCHPLFGRTLKLVGLASLAGHVRHCQVEIYPGRYGYVPVACTNLSTQPRPEPTLLTMDAMEDLLRIFQAACTAGRCKHAAKQRRVGRTARRRTSGDR